METEEHPGISSEEMDAIRREAMDFAGIGMYRYRFDGTIIFMDRGALRILDLEEKFPDESQVAGHNIADLIKYSLPKKSLRSEILKQKHIRDYRYPFETLTGKRRCVLHDSYLATDSQTGEEVIQVIIRDITALKEAEDQLDSERERLLVTLSSIGDGVISTDVDGRVLLLNAEAEKLTGWNAVDAQGRKLPEVFRIVNEHTRETVVNPVEKVLEDGMVVGLANDTILIARDGRETAIADSGAPIFDKEGRIIGVVLVFRNVEKERQIEQSRQRAEKLESLGVLAGGIAHDFNNYLTSILGNITLAVLELKQTFCSEKTLQMLQDAEKSSMWARGLTNQLLTFAKGGEPVRQIIKLPELIERCVNFVLSGSPVKLELDIYPELWLAYADPGQISQALDNLAINAKQAMAGGGSLRVRADNVNLGQGEIGDLPQGQYVRIAIEDQGTGIQAEHLSKLFDPYFTTKQAGSGLGLTTAYSIIRKHGGTIDVDSVLGEGSRFTVYLPACAGEVRETETREIRPGSGEKVLLMDDQDFVRRVGERTLSHLGYAAHCTEDGEDAVRLYKEAMEAGQPYDAVILDLTVPGAMGGLDALEELQNIDPDVCAIASSGYATNPVMADYESYGFKGGLTKPYTPDKVGTVLSQVLQD